MDFNVIENGSCTILELKGNIMGGPEAVDLHEKLHEILDSGKKNIVFDLSRVKFMNSEGLGMLTGALATMRNAGGDLCIANATDKIESLLIITKLDTVFKHFNSLEEAVDSFSK